MYGSETADSRFVRRAAGRRFEFSDGRFIVIARIDSGSTFKPVLSVGIVPRDNGLLAPSIRKQLGLKPVSVNLNVDDYLYQATQQHKRQQQGDMPSVGLVQSTASANALALSLLSLSLLMTIGLVSAKAVLGVN